MTEVDRVLSVLEGGPKVYGFARNGDRITLTMSFRGSDDDEFTIDADLRSAQFRIPDESDD